MTADDPGPPADRPLTARSVLASTLLGTEPPRLPVSFLVRTGELFGFAEGTVRTALSRMAASGEVIAEGDGSYALGEQLARRQRRQLTSRAAATADWSGAWRMAVVATGSRPPAERQELRVAMRRARFGELRDGVWLRPDNLRPADRADVPGVVTWFSCRPEADPDAVVASLWDLDRWARRATELREELASLRERLDRGELGALAPGFVLSAAVLRHFLADPLLPGELLPTGWPGPALRDDYEHYDRVYRQVLSGWATGGVDRAGADGASTVEPRD